MEIVGPNGKYKCKAWMRNPLAVLQEILENPTLKDKVVWAPQKAYDATGNRVFTDLHTSEWWWEIQVSHRVRPCADLRHESIGKAETMKATR
jgi:hypothetical protein